MLFWCVDWFWFCLFFYLVFFVLPLIWIVTAFILPSFDGSVFLFPGPETSVRVFYFVTFFGVFPGGPDTLLFSFFQGLKPWLGCFTFPPFSVFFLGGLKPPSLSFLPRPDSLVGSVLFYFRAHLLGSVVQEAGNLLSDLISGEYFDWVEVSLVGRACKLVLRQL